MPLRISSLFAVTLLIGYSSNALMAQTQGRTGTTGTQSTGTTGNTQSTGNSATNTSAATGNTAAGGQGNGGGQLQTASPVGNEPTFNAGDGSLGAQVGQGFTGRQNTGFVGNRNATTNNRGTVTPQFNQFTNQDPSQNNNNSSNSRTKRARPQLRIAFTNPKINIAQTQVELSDRLSRLANIQGVGASISDKGVATLTGTVTSEDSKKLAEALARLEPGVRSVKNDLQVAAAP